MPELPAGTVTFLFTDVEGSTRLLQDLGDRYADVLADHRRRLRRAFAKHGGVEVDTQGDALFVAFAKASAALAAAAEGRDALARGPIRVRMGLHTGEPLVTEEGYVGMDVHRAARIAAVGHGGQILVSQSTRDLAGSDGLRDLGEHRLKDLSEPERIYQLGADEFPPLKSLNQTNLPTQPTPLVGRQRELGEILELVGRSRLVTLTGAGGSGKTRLALQAAADVVDEHPDGVWFVSLAAVEDAEFFDATVARAIGARGDLAASVRGKKMLLLLDNLEQLLPEVAPLVARLDVRVLATSRARLNVSAEQVYAVPPLGIDDAVVLFTQRARQLEPGFEADANVPEIAHRLDGLPLALELAAARVTILTTAQIRERLAHSLDFLSGGALDIAERQRALRATIQWSYELLSEQERSAFARVAVFAGSFGLEAAEEICGVSIDVVQSLVEKSLLRRTDAGRFFMLETIREYAAERLAELPTGEELRLAHAEWLAALAAKAGPELRGADQLFWLDRLDDERQELRAALAWTVDEHPSVASRILGPTWPYWLARAHLGEARRWYEAALRNEGDPQQRMLLLSGLGNTAALTREAAVGRTALEERLAIARRLGDRENICGALNGLGIIALGENDAENSERFFGLAEDEAPNNSLRATSIGNRGIALAELGRLEEGLECAGRAVSIARELDDLDALATFLERLAEIELEAGKLGDAVEHVTEGLQLAHRLHDLLEVAQGLVAVGAILLLRSRPDEAARVLGAADEFFDRAGTVAWSRDPDDLYPAASERAAETLGRDRYRDLHAEGRELEPDAAVALALRALACAAKAP